MSCTLETMSYDPDDYGDGYSNEFQRQFAYETTQANADGRLGADPRIAELLAAGRFVVTYNYCVHCPHTDAVMGSKAIVHKDLATLEEAQGQLELLADEEAAACGDWWYEILPRQPLPVVEKTPADDDIPF
jgi:hypothetical protein